ncbi:MAG: L-idonate 5-dehydrogenase [Granulosicoccus sp.]|jgi:L-idonate 5-dehydrogenase
MKTKVVRLYKDYDLRIDEEFVPEVAEGQVLLRVGAGGICGSDLHYYHRGGMGDIRVVDPIILGHEASGTVEQVGYGVSSLSPGQRVAVNPSTPCNECSFCQSGLQQHCLNMRFFGSAMFRPHENGAFRQWMVVSSSNCVPVSDSTSLSVAAMSEPLAVCLHAVKRALGIAHNLRGKRIIVTGAGPIGCLCTAVASHLGASEILVTDIQSYTLSVARKMGATIAVNVAESSDTLSHYEDNKGYFDLAFECSGVESAMVQAIRVLKPQGTLVQVGNAGAMIVPFNRVVPRELNIMGSFRFHEEFATAAELLNTNKIDVRPMISSVLPIEQAKHAFELASDRSQSVKVLLNFQ